MRGSLERLVVPETLQLDAKTFAMVGWVLGVGR